MENNQIKEKSEKELLKENLECSQEILSDMAKIKKYLHRQMIWRIAGGVLKVLIFVVPIILAILYLPPYLKPLFEQYRDLLNSKF